MELSRAEYVSNSAIMLGALILVAGLTYMYGAVGFAIALALVHATFAYSSFRLKDYTTPVMNAVLGALAILLAYAFEWYGILAYFISVPVIGFVLAVVMAANFGGTKMAH